MYKELGKDWDSILTELHDQGFTHRSIDQIRSLYFKVRKSLHFYGSTAKFIYFNEINRIGPIWSSHQPLLRISRPSWLITTRPRIRRSKDRSCRQQPLPQLCSMPEKRKTSLAMSGSCKWSLPKSRCQPPSKPWGHAFRAIRVLAARKMMESSKLRGLLGIILPMNDLRIKDQTPKFVLSPQVLLSLSLNYYLVK